MKHAVALITALALLPGTVLLVGCGDPDLDDTAILDIHNLDDPKVREKILGTAIESKSFEKRGPILNSLYHQAGEQSPYTGWMKRIYDNGKVAMLGHIRGGKREGPSARWHENGKKSEETNYKDGRGVGQWIRWDKDGVKLEDDSVPTERSRWVKPTEQAHFKNGAKVK